MRIAVATDCNPGTSPLTSLLLAMNMAATLFGLDRGRMPRREPLGKPPVRLVSCGTRQGHWKQGKSADLAVWDVEQPAELGLSPRIQPAPSTYLHQGREGNAENESRASSGLRAAFAARNRLPYRRTGAARSMRVTRRLRRGPCASPTSPQDDLPRLRRQHRLRQTGEHPHRRRRCRLRSQRNLNPLPLLRRRACRSRKTSSG